MRNIIFYLLLVLLWSCHTATYVHDIESTPYGVNYQEGKWLLNEINAPEIIKDRISKIAFDYFDKHLGVNLTIMGDLRNISTPFIPIDPNTLVLEQLKAETNFDYVINILCQKSSNEIGNMKIGQTYAEQKNVAYSILEIYDLNSMETIYTRKVVGQVSINEDDNEDFALVKSANGIMIKCLKKILKKLN